MKRLVRWLMLAAPAATLAAGGHADGSPWTETRLEFRAGAFVGDFDTDVALTGPRAGTVLNLEDDLDLETEQTTFRGELTWRFADRHRVAVAYYDFDRTSTGGAERPFSVETRDQLLEFDAGVAVRTDFDWRLIPVTYTYSLFQNERFEGAATVGFHWTRFQVGVEGTARVNDSGYRTAAEDEVASVPLPVLGLQGDVALTRHWRLGARAQYFGLDYGDYSGNLIDARITTEYRFANALALGAGYTWYNLDLDKEDGPYLYAVDYGYQGPELYMTLMF